MAAPPNNKGLRRIINAYFFSMHGLKACIRTEEAFRQEIYLAAVLVPIAFWLGETWVEIILLIGSIALVLIVELLNTAVERAIDRISFEKHELSREAKDMGSAAVLLTLIFAALVWLAIGLPKIF